MAGAELSRYPASMNTKKTGWGFRDALGSIELNTCPVLTARFTQAGHRVLNIFQNHND